MSQNNALVKFCHRHNSIENRSHILIKEPGLEGCPQMGCGGYRLLLSERDGLDGAGGGKLNVNPPGDGADLAAPARLLFGVP